MMRRLRRALGAASLVADGPAQALEALRRRRGESSCAPLRFLPSIGYPWGYLEGVGCGTRDGG
ncbi:hypothetical protein ACWEWL_32595 [Streptomyces rochei]